jgi:hypothetical protein
MLIAASAVMGIFIIVFSVAVDETGCKVLCIAV